MTSQKFRLPQPRTPLNALVDCIRMAVAEIAWLVTRSPR